MKSSLLKYKARLINKESSNPSIFLGSLIYLIILIILSSLITRLNMPAMTVEQMDTLLTEVTGAVEAGRYEYASSLIPEVTPQSSLISTVLQILRQFVSIGFSLFVINIVRKNSPAIGNLLDGFQIPLKVFLINFLTGLFITLWMLLFIVPGIIAIYKYRQAKYILLDHPDWSVMQCITASKVMMNGHKMELFLLDLSFLGWAILGAIILPVKIYTLAYTESTYVLFYQQLAGIPDCLDAEKFYSHQEIDNQ